MNKSQIKTHLDTLYKDLLDNILFDDLKHLVRTKTFITGGCFKSLVLDETVNDYDFYFINKESAVAFKKIIKNGLKDIYGPFTNINNLKLQKTIETDNAITFKFQDRTIQFITKYFGFPNEVVNNFDFEHTKNFFFPAIDLMELNDEFIKGKELVFNTNATHPVGGLRRLVKFTSQGWKIDDDQLVEMAKAISKLNLSDKKVLKEQTVGLRFSEIHDEQPKLPF